MKYNIYISNSSSDKSNPLRENISYTTFRKEIKKQMATGQYMGYILIAYQDHKDSFLCKHKQIPASGAKAATPND